MPSLKQDPQQLNVREVIDADLASILELLQHLHEQEPVLSVDSRVQEVWRQFLEDPRLHHFVCEQDNVLLGACVLDIVPNFTRGLRPFAVLQNVVTHRDFRGLGVGRRLNEFALKFAWEKNCYQVLVQTGRAEIVAFYQKLGFRKEKIGLVAKPEWF